MTGSEIKKKERENKSGDEMAEHAKDKERD